MFNDKKRDENFSARSRLKLACKVMALPTKLFVFILNCKVQFM